MAPASWVLAARTAASLSLQVPMEHYGILVGNEHMLKEQIPGRGSVPVSGHRAGRADFREVGASAARLCLRNVSSEASSKT